MWRYGLIFLSISVSACTTISLHPAPVRDETPVLERGWSYSETSEEYFKTMEAGVVPVDFSSPTIEGDRIILATARLGLSVINKDNGQMLWHRKAKTETFNGKPLVFQNNIIVGSEQGWVHSFRLDTGVEFWKIELPTSIRSAAVGAGDRIILTAADESVYALDPATGKILWTYKRPSFVGTSIYGSGNPAYIGGRIWVGFSDGALVELEPNDGSVIFEKSLRDNLKFNDVDAKPLPWKENILIPNYDGKLRLIKRDGTTIWEFPAGGARSPVITSYLGSSLVFSSSDGAVYLISAETGHEQWRHILKRGIPTGIGVIEDEKNPYVIVASSDQYIYALDLKTGKEVGKINLGRSSGSYSNLVVDAATRSVFVLSQFSRLYQIRVR